MRSLVAVFTLALLGAGNADGRYFLGNWSCGSVPWTFASFVGDTWIRVSYGDPKAPDGTAVMGYVSGLKSWVYRDFHTDGSYADLTSPGPDKGRWVWSGPYFPSDGSPPLNGRITYIEMGKARYDRVFETLSSGEYTKMGGDSCTRSP